MIYDILEQKLTADGFVEGETLFRNHMPAECVVGVMSRAPISGIPINPNIPNYYKGRMQIIIRHKDPIAGHQMAGRVQKLLTVEAREHYPASEERGETHLDLFRPETIPIFFPRLDGNGFEWSQHFETVFGMKSTF